MVWCPLMAVATGEGPYAACGIPRRLERASIRLDVVKEMLSLKDMGDHEARKVLSRLYNNLVKTIAVLFKPYYNAD